MPQTRLHKSGRQGAEPSAIVRNPSSSMASRAPPITSDSIPVKTGDALGAPDYPPEQAAQAPVPGETVLWLNLPSQKIGVAGGLEVQVPAFEVTQ